MGQIEDELRKLNAMEVLKDLPIKPAFHILHLQVFFKEVFLTLKSLI